MDQTAAQQPEEERPGSDKGPWERFVELRNSALARGVDIDRRPGRPGRPGLTRAPPRGPAVPSRATRPGRDRNVFVILLVVVVLVCAVFLVVVGLAG